MLPSVPAAPAASSSSSAAAEGTSGSTAGGTAAGSDAEAGASDGAGGSNDPPPAAPESDSANAAGNNITDEGNNEAAAAAASGSPASPGERDATPTGTATPRSAAEMAAMVAQVSEGAAGADAANDSARQSMLTGTAEVAALQVAEGEVGGEENSGAENVSVDPDADVGDIEASDSSSTEVLLRELDAWMNDIAGSDETLQAEMANRMRAFQRRIAEIARNRAASAARVEIQGEFNELIESLGNEQSRLGMRARQGHDLDVVEGTTEGEGGSQSMDTGDGASAAGSAVPADTRDSMNVTPARSSFWASWLRMPVGGAGSEPSQSDPRGPSESQSSAGAAAAGASSARDSRLGSGTVEEAMLRMEEAERILMGESNRSGEGGTSESRPEGEEEEDGERAERADVSVDDWGVIDRLSGNVQVLLGEAVRRRILAARSRGIPPSPAPGAAAAAGGGSGDGAGPGVEEARDNRSRIDGGMVSRSTGSSLPTESSATPRDEAKEKAAADRR